MRECIVIDCRITKITNYERTVGNTRVYRLLSHAKGVSQTEATPLLRLLPSRLPSLQPTALQATIT